MPVFDSLTVPTLGQALRASQSLQFAGRQPELAFVRAWLGGAPPFDRTLAITGPGGIGKSTLLGECARLAEGLGFRVCLVDGRTIPATPEALLATLAGALGLADASPNAVIDRLNTGPALLLLDSFEELAPLRRFLTGALLPRLAGGVGVIFASRHTEHRWSAVEGAWPLPVRTLPLAGLEALAARDLLARRGLTDPALCAEALAAAGGHPLALTLAADLTLQFGARAFARASEWPLIVRGLVERLLEGVDDPALLDLLEAAAIVRQFDEATLAAITGNTDTSTAFARLCRLAIVRPAEHGLTIHDDIRRLLAADLRWRRPDHFAALRLRALTWLRARMQTAPAEERPRLLGERIYLWGHAIVLSLMFSDVESSDVWVEPAGPADLPEVMAMWRSRPTAERDEVTDIAEAILATEVSSPDTRTRIVRWRDGRALGFSIMQPLCRDVLARHPAEGALHASARALFGDPYLDRLPVRGGDATHIAITNLTCIDHPARGLAQAALLRDLTGALAGGAAYLAITRDAAYERLLQAACFTLIPGSACEYGHPGSWSHGYLLDLSRLGIDAWIGALISGDGLPRLFSRAELEQALTEALRSWADDAALARSPLLRLAPVMALPREERGPDGLRRLIRDVLRARANAAGPAVQPALRALELGYLTSGPSHEAAAERLAVSRATFFRHLRRGIEELASALDPGASAQS